MLRTKDGMSYETLEDLQKDKLRTEIIKIRVTKNTLNALRKAVEEECERIKHEPYDVNDSERRNSLSAMASWILEQWRKEPENESIS